MLTKQASGIHACNDNSWRCAAMNHDVSEVYEDIFAALTRRTPFLEGVRGELVPTPISDLLYPTCSIATHHLGD